ncbi:hypothetical protein JF55_09820 [Pseudomonas sp. 1-7]|nr:hypothetical protein JF55_09820 [Pseudomonas sp. 1-7]
MATGRPAPAARILQRVSPKRSEGDALSHELVVAMLCVECYFAIIIRRRQLIEAAIMQSFFLCGRSAIRIMGLAGWTNGSTLYRRIPT